jgi:hypothetical protein
MSFSQSKSNRCMSRTTSCSIDPNGTTYPNDWGDLPHNPLDDFLAVSVAVDCKVCKRSHYFQLRAGEKYGVYALAVKDVL